MTHTFTHIYCRRQYLYHKQQGASLFRLQSCRILLALPMRRFSQGNNLLLDLLDCLCSLFRYDVFHMCELCRILLFILYVLNWAPISSLPILSLRVKLSLILLPPVITTFTSAPTAVLPLLCNTSVSFYSPRSLLQNARIRFHTSVDI